MTKRPNMSDAQLRQFLLGKLADEERQEIESLFIVDSQAKERVITAEQDLIEDYLEGNLTASEREIFLLHYAQTPAQRRKLRITRSIKNWADAESAARQDVLPTTLSRFRTWVSPKSAAVIPVAATIVIAVVIVAVWFSRRPEQRNNHSQIEQELARLNTPTSLRDVPGGLATWELRPVTVRSAAPQLELKLSAESRLIELRLLRLGNEQYSTYEVLIRRPSGEESFIVRNIQNEDDPGKAIRVRVPAKILSKGLYQIELRGVTADGSANALEEYSFAVTD